jgi:hypothetical protein
LSFFPTNKIDALRRKHIYDEFIVTYLKILAENGKLEEIMRASVSAAAAATTGTTSTQPSTLPYNLTLNTLFLHQPVSKKQRKK